MAEGTALLEKTTGREAAAVDRTGEPASPVETRVSEVPAVLFPVVAIVDGDTIKVSIDGNVETLRLIGIDTPETKDPRKPVQCFGKEASAKAAELLSGRRVRLETDPTQGDRGEYGRLLRYLWREDGLFFNEWMIRNGYAHEYTYISHTCTRGGSGRRNGLPPKQPGPVDQAACASATTEAAARPAPAPPLQTAGGGHIFLIRRATRQRSSTTAIQIHNGRDFRSPTSSRSRPRGRCLRRTLQGRSTSRASRAMPR